MSLSLIFFFLSLTALVAMISRKVMLGRKGRLVATHEHHLHVYVSDLRKLKDFVFRNANKLGYIAIFVTLRWFIKSSNFLKIRGQILVKTFQNKFGKNKNSPRDLVKGTAEKKGGSKYLKTITKYRQKIRKIKLLIRKEEGIQ